MSPAEQEARIPLTTVKRLASTGATVAQIRVLLVIAAHVSRTDGRAFPSQATIAALAGVSRRTVINAVEFLEAHGFIRVERLSRRAPLAYGLTFGPPSGETALAPLSSANVGPSGEKPCTSEAPEWCNASAQNVPELKALELRELTKALFEAFGTHADKNQLSKLGELLALYPDDALKRIKYGIGIAMSGQKTCHANYAIACARNASIQDLDRHMPKKRTCLSCSGTGTRDDAECDVCLGTGRQLSDSEFKEVIRARSET